MAADRAERRLKNAREDFTGETRAHRWVHGFNEGRTSRVRDDTLADARDTFYTALDAVIEPART